MRKKYWYDKFEDKIVAVQELKRSIHIRGQERLFEWLTANSKVRLFSPAQIQELLKDSPDELIPVRQDYLDQQINKYEKLKILEVQVVEFVNNPFQDPA